VTTTEADLEELAQRFAAARSELAVLRRRVPEVQTEIATLKPQVLAAIVEDIRSRRRSQAEVSRLTGYTAERIRQICRAEGVDPA
jgi:cell division protein FtsB